MQPFAKGLQGEADSRSLPAFPVGTSVMKLFYSRGACSMAAHIVLHEIGAKFEVEQVDLKSKQTGSGADYKQINPKGYVPALQLDDGELLTENVAILTYLAELKPEAGLAPTQGAHAKYRLLEWLGFVSSEVHKNYSPLFSPLTPEAYKPILHERLKLRIGYLDAHLAGRQYLFGHQFSVADAYLYVVLNWSKGVNVDLSTFANVRAFQELVTNRPAVQAAMRTEGLVK
jgi:glutathione S-transferase